MLHTMSEWVPPSEKKKGFINKMKRFLDGATSSPELEHYRWLSYVSPEAKSRLYSRRFAEALGASDATRPVLAKLGEPRDDFLNRQLFADFKLFLSDDILVKVDRMSMATSLEARAPFLDKDVVELAFRMPGHLKLRGGTRKYALKKAMSGMLPERILHRRKEGFSIPMKNWLRTELSPLMNELLARERIENRGLFEWREVERLRREHVEGRANHAHQLFPMMVFERWAEEYLR